MAADAHAGLKRPRRQWASRIVAVTLLLLLSACAVIAPAFAAPKAELWERWTLNDPDATRVLNHGLWRDFLQRYVTQGEDGIARVHYADVSFEDGGMLRVYLDQLQRTPVSTLRPAEQLAYWINLYNAQTLKLVLDRYPVASIQAIAISPGFFAKGPWGAKLIKVEDQTLSLDDIQHRILRPIWRDPRVHYALACAALGCPDLAREAYTAANTETMLQEATRAYVNHPRGVRMEEDGRLRVSSLYVWFRSDFGDTDTEVIAHLLRHAEPPLAQALQNVRRIAGHAFDWTLNDAR